MPAPPSPSHAPSPRLRRPSSSSSAPPAPLVTRPPSATRSAEARLVVPELIRDPSAFESLATTLRTWSPFDAPPWTQANAHSPDSSTSARLPAAGVGAAGGGGAARSAGALMLGEDDDDDAEGDAGPPHEARASTGEPPLPELGERVAWARWDALLDGTNEPRRILILGYSSGGLAVWDCSDLDCWLELLNLPTLDCALDDKVRKLFRHGVDRVVGAAVLPPSSSRSALDPLEAHRPLLAVVARPKSHQSSSSVILLYSLRAHRIVSTLAVPGIAHRIVANRRFLVVSTTSPLALHVYQPTASTSGYAPAPFSPITDVLAAPTSTHSLEAAAPVFDLGAGGRLLAYASSSSVPSATLSRAPARPGVGILAHRGQFDADALSAFGSADGPGAGFSVHDAEEVARRVGEGVRSGMAALRERGGSWLRGGGGGGSAEPGAASSTAGGAYSKSAPQLGMGGLSSMSSRQGTSGPSAAAEASPAVGTVKVVDLVTSTRAPAPHTTSRSRSTAPPALRVAAHFRPYAQQVALVSLAPSSTMILVASAAGHSFDIFELKPAVPIGVSATSSSTSMGAVGGDGLEAQVWHRYRLQRGYTSALAASASWSLDGRFVAVSTIKGTAHVWAVQPGGGTPRIESHFAPQVNNAEELAPLSVGLGSVARVRQPRVNVASSSSSRPRASAYAPMPVAVIFLPKSGSAASSLQPPFTRERSPPSFQDVLVLRPSTGSATLHRLTAQRSPPPTTTPSAAADLVRSGDVGRLASTAVSGLSQLMRSRGGALLGSTMGGGAGAHGPPGSSARAGVGAGAPGQEGNGAWSVRCVGIAEWAVGREHGAGASEVREEVRALEKVDQPALKGVRFSAFAEIETCSRSPLVLPRSIYQSQQFVFYALPPDHAWYTIKGSSALPLRRLEMRSEVQVRQGDGSTSSDAGPSSSPSSSSGARYLGSHGGASTSSSFEPASFDQPIKTAMHALLDFDQVAPGSPQLPPPTFPNGVPGKHGSWRDSIAIPRSVGPAAIESLGRVRQGLGRVKVPSGIALPGSVGRRRSSVAATGEQPVPAGVVAAATYSSSISFDDEDAVFADRLEGSLSTACTSELGDGGGKGVARRSSVGAEDADEEDWGWDDRVDEDEPPAGAGARRSDSSGALASLREIAPFDEDFDDLDLGLAPSPSVAVAHKAAAVVSLAVPSPLALEPVDAEPATPAAVVERHLAPPVSVFATSLDDSVSPSTSPGSPSGFDPTAIMGSGSAAVAHRQLLDRPSSAMSGLSILGATAAQSLAAPTNGGLSSSSGGSTSGSMIGSQLQSSKSSSKKKKGRR
ncbi:hypothetical protein JCM9279_004782 [Rhodotorula babjevae]